MKKIAGNLLLLFAVLLLGGCYNDFFRDREARVEDGAILQILAPEKVIYDLGEPLDLTGLTVIAEYPSGNSVLSKGGKLNIPEGYSLSWNGKAPQNDDTDITAQLGIKTITAEWRGLRGNCAIMVLNADPNAADTAPDFTVTDADGWKNALYAISREDSGTVYQSRYYTLNISGTISVPGTADNSITGEYKTMILQGNGTLSLDGKGSLLWIGKNQTVVINGPTLQGNTGNNTWLVRIGGGTAELWRGSIEDNTGGGVSVDGMTGVFIMKGGTIKNNTLTLTRGMGNINGGGIYIDRYGSFTMTGGTISGNSAQRGGGVYVNSSISPWNGEIFANEHFTKTGGIIHGNNVESNANTATEPNYGQAVYLQVNNTNNTFSHYYRNETLDEGDDISTGDLTKNWTMEDGAGWKARLICIPPYPSAALGPQRQ